MPFGGARRSTDCHRHLPFRREEARCATSPAPLRAGTPARDHIGDIVASLDVDEFQRCFVAWVSALLGVPEGVAAIDGYPCAAPSRVDNVAIYKV